MKKKNLKGACTLTLNYIDESKNQLISNYIGDSCYMILRKEKINPFQYKIFFKSTPMQSEFNCPFQLNSKINLEENELITNIHNLEKDDLIIVASDG